MYASQEVQVSSKFAGQKHTSGTRKATQEQLRQRPRLTIFKTQLIQHTKEKEHQKPLNKKNLRNGLSGFQKLSKSYIITTREKTRPQDAQTSGTNWHRTEKTSRRASGSSRLWVLLSPVFCSRRFELSFGLVQKDIFFTLFLPQVLPPRISALLSLTTKPNLTCTLLLHFWKT